MASAITRRQQVRNERLLQDLIKSVPGNELCADCSARNPGWASWSLGIFLCMRCAALHRKLGTHISKVKSLSMDSWSNEHIENMKRIGNVESNRLFNPRNVKPSIPIDVDEVDGAMERFIRQKYEHRVFSGDSRPGTRQNTGSTSSVEDRPPPLPPKPTKKFGLGLRANSSTFPTARPSSGKLTPPISPGVSFGAEISKNGSPPRINKASKIFGSNIERPGDSFESKLGTLRDMGFADEKRNATVLKGLNGNLDKTVEALIRLGDGSRRPSRTHTPNTQAVPTSVNGISIDRTKSPSATSSSNPFEALDHAQPTPPQQLAPLQTQFRQNTGYTQSPANGYNPFLPPMQASPNPQQGLEQSFQNLNLAQAQPQQLLSAHSTGSIYTQTPQTQSNPFMPSFTPPIPQASQFPSPFQPQQTWSPQSAHPLGANSPVNPFLRTSRSQIFSQPVQSLSSTLYTMQNSPATNSPYAGQTPQNPFLQQQNAQLSFSQAQPQPQMQSYVPNNPFRQSPPMQQQQFQQQQQFAQQPMQNHTGYFAQQPLPDPKSSILSLYNHSQLTPNHLAESSAPATPADGPAQPQPFGPLQRSVTMPVLGINPMLSGPTAASTGTTPATPNIGSRGLNPFASGTSPRPTVPTQAPMPNGPGVPSASLGNSPNGAAMSMSLSSAQGLTPFSRDSVDFAGLMAGRHSPDAFKNLSSRWGVS